MCSLQMWRLTARSPYKVTLKQGLGIPGTHQEPLLWGVLSRKSSAEPRAQLAQPACCGALVCKRLPGLAEGQGGQATLTAATWLWVSPASAHPCPPSGTAGALDGGSEHSRSLVHVAAHPSCCLFNQATGILADLTFVSSGNCTWGMNCRFIHPGVNDKGNYSLITKADPFPPNGAPPLGPHPLMPANPWVREHLFFFNC